MSHRDADGFVLTTDVKVLAKAMTVAGMVSHTWDTNAASTCRIGIEYDDDDEGGAPAA